MQCGKLFFSCIRDFLHIEIGKAIEETYINLHSCSIPMLRFPSNPTLHNSTHSSLNFSSSFQNHQLFIICIGSDEGKSLTSHSLFHCVTTTNEYFPLFPQNLQTLSFKKVCTQAKNSVRMCLTILNNSQ